MTGHLEVQSKIYTDGEASHSEWNQWKASESNLDIHPLISLEEKGC